MIKFENTKVTGWEAAIRGMRNPMNSLAKSDSCRCDIDIEDCPHSLRGTDPAIECNNGKFGYCIGENDLKLMRSLANAGTDHSKFARMIIVTVDITAPLYWWKEFDTYKVGTVANSCSTMHKIHEKEFALDDFSHEHLFVGERSESGNLYVEDSLDVLEKVIFMLNYYRKEFLESKDKKAWWQMIQILPTSYNQRRTVQLSYQNAWHMRSGRYDHKLDEWHLFCDWVDALPYFKEIYLDGKKEKDIRAKWIDRTEEEGEGYWKCSNCEEPWVLIEGTPAENKMNYCPNCGAKMEW